jgi:hypothetical protein
MVGRVGGEKREMVDIEGRTMVLMGGGHRVVSLVGVVEEEEEGLLGVTIGMVWHAISAVYTKQHTSQISFISQSHTNTIINYHFSFHIAVKPANSYPTK